MSRTIRRKRPRQVSDRPIDRFDDRGYTWIWEEDAPRVFPAVPPRALQGWVEHYCRWLGKKLDAIYRMVPGTRRQRLYERRYVREDQLCEISNAIAANKPIGKTADDADAIPWPEASKISGLSKHQLFRGHRHGCDLFGGKKLWSGKIRVADKRGRLFAIRHYSERQMEEIKQEAKRRQEAGEVCSDPVVPGYLSRTQFETENGIPYDSLLYHSDKKKKKRGLKGGIKTQQVCGAGKGKSSLTYSLRKDAEKYVKERQDPSQLDKAKTFLKDLLKPGPVRFGEVMKQGRIHDLSEKSLRRAKRALKISATQRGYQSPCYWHFPEDENKVPLKLPTAQQRPLRVKAIALIRQALAEGATRFRDVKELGLKDGISEGSMFLAWKEVREGASAQAAEAAAANVPANTTPAEPFDPSPLQSAILDLLGGKSMIADDLEFKLRVDRRRLFYGGTPDGRGGLAELKERGLVVSGRGKGIRGYFRPDRPPISNTNDIRNSSEN